MDFDDEEYRELLAQWGLRATEPVREPMRRHKTPVNPSRDDLKVRRKNNRRTAAETFDTGGDVQKRAELVRAYHKASSLAEQARLLDQIAQLDNAKTAAAAEARGLDFEAAKIVEQTLAPVRVHEFHTAATDWIGYEETLPGDWQNRVIAEAAAWYSRVPDMVKQDGDEYAIQAEGKARNFSGQFGLQAEAARQTFEQYAQFLRTQAASGLDQIQQTIDPNNSPKTTPLPTEVFDNFAPEIDPINQGVSGTETSDRAPLINEIVNGGSGMDGGAPEKPGGHSTDDELSWSPPEGMQADTAPGWTDGDPGSPEKGGDRPDYGKKSSLIEAPSMAIGGFNYTLDDFRREAARKSAAKERGQGKAEGGRKAASPVTAAPKAKQAASGLPMIQETVDANNQPHAPTPIPPAVAFPLDDEFQPEWTTNGTGDAQPGGKTASREDDPYCSLCGGKIMSARSINSSFAPGWTHVDEPGTWTHPTSSDLQPPVAPTGSGDDWKYHSSERSDEDHPPVPHDGRTLEEEEARTARKNQELLKSLQEENRVNKTFDDMTRNFHDGARKQADMWGNSDEPHAVVQPDVANTPATTPPTAQQGGRAAGAADARANEDPSFSDDSSHVPTPAQQYAEGYQSVDQTEGLPQDEPASLAGPGKAVTHAGSKTSSLIVTAAERENPDFRKGYGYASRWTPGTVLVSTGSASFEAGVYAGISDNAEHQRAFVEAHRTAAAKHPVLGARVDRHKAMTHHIAAKNEVGTNGLYLVASTSIDLNTMAPNTTPAADGSTPINGPGRPGPLDGQQDAAAPGGPAPYNGAEPFGSPVVPGANQTQAEPSPADALIGGGGMSTPQQLQAAFRRKVQASLLASKHGK